MIEEHMLHNKSCSSWKLIVLWLNITTLVKFILFSSTCSVQLTCHVYIFFYILDFQSSILHKLKNILNCRLKLNKDNNCLFWLLTLLVLSNLKLLKYKLQKILKNIKCSRNFEFGKRTNQNLITQNLHHGKEYCIS